MNDTNKKEKKEEDLIDKVISIDEYGQRIEQSTTKKKLSAIYLLPNLFTTGALLGGFYSILAAIDGNFEKAAICVFLAMILDGLDGRVARITKTQSAFGEQYDSLSDLVSFGVAPALIVYLWSLHHISEVNYLPGKLSWMIPFLYCACAAMRLARFNVQTGNIDSKYFIGLPSPTAAATVVGFVWFGEWHGFSGESLWPLSLLITLCSGLLMVSPIKYYSFKKIDNKKVSLLLMVIFAFTLALIINYTPILWIISFAYTLSGIFILITASKKRKIKKPNE